MTAQLTEETVINWIKDLSNWGRWGSDDQRGTLNLITNDVRKKAASLIREGVSVSCTWPMRGQRAGVAGDMTRFMLETGEGLHEDGRSPLSMFGGMDADMTMRARWAIEHVAYEFHGMGITHLDAPCHYFWDGQLYNGAPATTVSAAFGASRSAVTEARGGFMTRGILVDLADLNRAATPQDVEEALGRAGLDVQPGDALFLRTGLSRIRHAGEEPPATFVGGWDATMLPWLREKDVSAIGSDVANDTAPTAGFREMYAPIHIVGLVALGLWLIDNLDLEELAATCAQYNRWDFHLAVQPLPMEGATGSAVNPIATF